MDTNSIRSTTHRIADILRRQVFLRIATISALLLFSKIYGFSDIPKIAYIVLFSLVTIFIAKHDGKWYWAPAIYMFFVMLFLEYINDFTVATVILWLVISLTMWISLLIEKSWGVVVGIVAAFVLACTLNASTNFLVNQTQTLDVPREVDLNRRGW